MGVICGSAKQSPGGRGNHRMCLAVLFGVMGAAMLSTGAEKAGRTPAPTRPPSAQQRIALFARLPLRFEPNRGQTDGRVKFLARGLGYTLFLTSNAAVLAFSSTPPSSQPKPSTSPRRVFRLELLGTHPAAPVWGEEALAGESNYFLGNDPRRWQTHIPTYAQVRYHHLYRGVDLVYYGHQGQLEYDFVVEPGADPKAIRLGIEAGKSRVESRKSKVAIDAHGDLVIETDGGEVRLHKPVVYQPKVSLKSQFRTQNSELLNGRYVLTADKRVSFEVEDYDRSRPLIIDPVLSYSTYLGGTGGDVANGIAVDSSGNAYIAGITNSTDFPTASPEQGTSQGNGDAFVAKLNSTGSALVYSTYLGGTGADTATAIAVDASGDAYVTGTTTSPNFPTTSGVFQPGYAGNGDAFVTQINSAGSKLVYSSYLGGTLADFGQGIAVDTSGNAYVTGSTQSVDFPTVKPLQSSNGGASDAFVAKVNFSGTQLVYSTYLGGSQADVGQAVRVDTSGNAYVMGYTFSADFPTVNPLQRSNAGQSDAFVSEVNGPGSALVFSTYLGGSGVDKGFGIARDTSGNIYLTGLTQSTDFPTTSSAFQATNRGPSSAFATKLNPSASGMLYSTFLGGSGANQGNGIAVDSSGDAFVTGFTQASDFPTANAVQAILGISGGGSCGSTVCADAFVSQLNPSGNALVYSTYLGGSGADFGQAIALDSTGNPYVAGSTSSRNFPAIAGAFQGSLAGVAGTAFAVKIDKSNAPGIAIVPQKVNFGNQTVGVRSAVQTVAVIDAGTQPLAITQITTSNSDFAETDNCVGTVSAGAGTCSINVTFTPSSATGETGQISFTDNAAGSPHTLALSGTGVTAATAVTVSPNSLTFSNQTVGTVSAPQSVTITNTGTSTLSISSISTTGDFSQTNTCGATLNLLNVGQSCSVSVTFAPTASGARSGTLSISDNATGSPQTVALAGTGVAVFSLSAPSSVTSAVIGTASVTFTVSVSAPGSFTGSVSLSCATGATCSFNPASIFVGQTSTLTVSGLTASTPNPFNFTVNGSSGSQSATLSLSVLFSDYSLSATPALNTIVSGAPAGYTVIVTPLNGFNQAVKLACTGLPAGAGCNFSNASPTPNGAGVNVTLTVTTTKSSVTFPHRWNPPAPPARHPLLVLWMALGVLGSMIILRRRLGGQLGSAKQGAGSLRSRLVFLGLVLALAALLGSCRAVSPVIAGGTPTGNYTITITGTLGSNIAVVRSTTVNLSVT